MYEFDPMECPRCHSPMNVAVLGSGNGGLAVAFDYASHGHEVSLFDFEKFPGNIRAVQVNKGIYAEGQLEGFAPVVYAGHDIKKTCKNADLVMIVGPACSTRPFAQTARRCIQDGQIIIVCPGSCCGSLEFMNGVGLTIGETEVTVAETSTLPYAVRGTGPGRIRVFLKLKAGLLLAAIPASRTGEVLERIKDVYPSFKPAKNVMQTSLQNANPVIHPSISIANAALIERTGGDFFFYHDGVTPAVGRLVKAVDEERIAIGKKLGLEVIPDPEMGLTQGYMKEATYDAGYSKAPGFEGIKAQPRLDYRYFHEDVGYGLVFLTDLARQLGVETPVMEAVIKVASILMDRDYMFEKKRTMESLGIAGKSPGELDTLLA